MRRLVVLLGGCVALSGCMTTRPPVSTPSPWDARAATLQRAAAWQLDGRAAVALGTQGWQASLNWHQRGASAEVHLAGPFGVGALILTLTPAGLSLNGAPPSDAVVAQLQDRLGFDLPLEHLRYWVLGVPDPGSTFDLDRDDKDRAKHLAQAGWSIDYDRYMPVAGDVMPAHFVLSRAGARVKIAVDHWEGIR